MKVEAKDDMIISYHLHPFEEWLQQQMMCSKGQGGKDEKVDAKPTSWLAD